MTQLDERELFEAFVEEWTGKDMAFHREYMTTGIEFAWAAWQAARSQQWRPISEAPSDGTRVLAWDGRHIGTASFSAGEWGSATLMGEPVLWQPLPAPPVLSDLTGCGNG